MAAVIDAESGEVIDGGSVSEYTQSQEHAALDVQVSTAHAYPRSVQTFQSDLEAWSMVDRDTALGCFYKLSRGGSTIIGPSTRFAELVVSAWGNIVVDTAIVTEERDHVIVSATCRDLQRNTAMRSQVRRNITTKEGRRYGADMIQTTIQAASAIARRNAIFQTVPRALWLPIWQKARHLALAGNDGETFTEKRKRILKGLKEAGCNPQHIKHAVGGKEPKDLSADDVLVLEVSLRRIIDNESTPDQEFPRPVNDGEEPGEKASAVADAMKSAKSKTEDAQPDVPGDAAAGSDNSGQSSGPAVSEEEADRAFGLGGEGE